MFEVNINDLEVQSVKRRGEFHAATEALSFHTDFDAKGHMTSEPFS